MYLVVDVQESCMYTKGTSYSYMGGDEVKNVNLVKSREKKKLTQEQLAKALGYKGKQSVANWENGHISPPLETALKISRILEQDIFFLFGNLVQETHTLKSKEVI